jgi:hypothetical protein
VFWFSVQLLCEAFLTARRNQRDVIENVYRSAVQCRYCISVCCTVPLLYIGLLYSAVTVYRSACTVPLLYIGLLYSAVTVYRSAVQCRYSDQISKQLEYPRLILEKFSNNKFHKSPSSGSPVVP